MIESITVRGFRTIRSLEGFGPGSLTVLIGPNGAGKSNLISFFELLSYAMNGRFAERVAVLGGASNLLFDGPAVTRELDVHLALTTETGRNEYGARWVHAAGDALIQAEEKYRYSAFDIAGDADWRVMDPGARESQLPVRQDQTARVIRGLLQKIVVHQFHNTSPSARIRNKFSVGDGRWLKQDGGNLAALLYRLRDEQFPYYSRIVQTIRGILPFFHDFLLEPESGYILLRWREKNTDRIFDASSASDGMLRAMALITLLRQPEDDLPRVLILDEPELGLHPSAIEIVASLLRAASKLIQVIVATQSVAFLDRMPPESVVVVERPARASEFRRPPLHELQTWLDEFSMSEMWQRNLIGGRP